MQILYYRKKVFIEKRDNETFPKKSSSWKRIVILCYAQWIIPSIVVCICQKKFLD